MWGSVYLFEIASSVTKIKNNITLTSLNVHYFYTGEIIVLCLPAVL